MNIIFSLIIELPFFKRIVFVLLFAAVFDISTTKAQEPIYYELWGNYSTRRYIENKKFWFLNTYGIQSASDAEESFSQFFILPRLNINMGNYLEFAPGLDLRYSYYYELPDVLEIRIKEGVHLHWPQINHFYFDHSYNFEQRFYFTEGSKKDEIGLRSRYKIRVRIAINNKAITDNTFFNDILFEIFMPHDNNIDEVFANNLRFGIVAGYNRNTEWRYLLSVLVDHGKDKYYNNRTVDKVIVSFTVRRIL